MKKVTFRLEQDEDGYPPFAVEDLWMSETEVPDEYVVNNIPFFARQATVGDRVRVVNTADGSWFDRVVAGSANSLLRAIFFDKSKIASVRETLNSLGCSSEAFKGIAILAVLCPGDVDYVPVQAYLNSLKENGVIDYEEAIIRH